MAKPEKKKYTKQVQVAHVEDPKFLTLTKKPANQIGFRIVREEGQTRVIRQRPVRRMAPTLAMQFPDGLSEDDVRAVMQEFGFSDYKLKKVDDHYVATRADVKKFPENYGTIHLRDGIKALIAQEVAQASDANPKPHLSVVEIDFNKDQFPDPESVRGWLDAHGIDFSGDVAFNSSNKAVVLRQTVEKDIEVKRLEVEEGVEAVVARADTPDVPPALILVVNEQMYGNWGWGQLDFAAAMADIEYSEAARAANEVLMRVLDQLLFWSPLPVTVRKELVSRVTAEYAAFISSLLDQLPARVVMQDRSDNKGDVDMKTKEQEAKEKAELKKRADEARVYLKANVENGEEAAKQDDAKVIELADAAKKEIAKREAEEKEKKEKAGKEYVTRAELDAAFAKNNETLKAEIAPTVGNAVRESLKSIFAPAEQRSDDEGKNKDKDAADMGKVLGDAIRSAIEPVAASLKETAETVKKQGTTMEALTKTVEGIASQTVVRGEGDGKQGKDKGQKKDVFRGMFSKNAAKPTEDEAAQ